MSESHDGESGSADVKEKALGDQLLRFIDHITSLSESLPLTMLIAGTSAREADKDFRTFLEQSCILEKEEGDNRIYSVPFENHFRYTKLKNAFQRCKIAYKILPRSFLVSLVSQFDAFLGGVVRVLLYSKPELLNASDRVLTFKELLQFSSTDEAREYVVEKEVESLIRKSHPEQFEWMEKKFSVPLREGLPSWPVFVEVTERRNLFVHCDGIVSSQYLKNCREHNVEVATPPALGSELNVTPAYFGNAYQCVFEIGVKLCHVLWRKLLPGELEHADRNLIEVTFELLRDENYRLAKNLLDFASCTFKRHSSDEQRRVFIVNRAQAYKWEGDNDAAVRILRAEDWSACDDKFKLAVAVLQENYDTAASLMKKIGPAGSVTKVDYREWPLFQRFRTTAQFSRAFTEVYGESLSPMETELTTEKKEAVN